MSATTEKVRENRMRATAKRQGYQLVKSRRRDPRAIGYGGYMIVEPDTGTIEAGDLTHGGMSLDDVEMWLTSDDADVLVAWALTDEEARDLDGAGQLSPTGRIVISREGMRKPETGIEAFGGHVGADRYSFDEAAADKLLEANGYRRTSPWVPCRTDGHECQVEANVEEQA